MSMNLIIELTSGIAPRKSYISLFSLYSLWRSRRALAQLDHRILDDIGVSYSDAQTESQRGFFDIPKNWVR